MNALWRRGLVLAFCCAGGCRGEQEDDPYAPLSRNALRSDVLGCYQLLGAGREPLDSTYYDTSPLVHVDSGLIGGPVQLRYPMRLLHKLGPDGDRLDSRRAQEMGGPPGWLADSLTDSIRLDLSRGLSGIQLVLDAPRGAGDTLHGRAREFTDVGPPFEINRGRVFAIRRPCVDSEA
jgi:hypothetical protein